MLLGRQKYLVKEQVGLLRMTARYDIFDPETGEKIGQAREQIGFANQVLRMFINKQLLPTTIAIREDEQADPVVTITRGIQFLRAKVNVVDGNNTLVGFFRSKLFAFGGGFTVHSAEGEQIADVKGDWKGWDFKLLDMHGNQMGRVNKKWAGAMKELFTSADNYLISLDESVGSNPGLAALLLAAGLAIDIVYKENK